MTVCVAAISGAFAFGASDRMLSAASVEFEPTSSKMYELSSSLAVMIAGDISIHSMAVARARDAIKKRIDKNPQEWISVEFAASLYSTQMARVIAQRHQNLFFGPYGMTADDFAIQKELLNPSFYDVLHKSWIQHIVGVIPKADAIAIVVGVDTTGAHIYQCTPSGVSCEDTAGFCSIGIGSRHANSEFMVAKHTSRADPADTIILTYSAKKRAEVMAGVGKETDMFLIGGLGRLSVIAEKLKRDLARIYDKRIKAEKRALKSANKDTLASLEKIAKESSAQQAQSTTPEITNAQE